MKKKLVLLTSLLSVFSGATFAQQDKLLTHFMYDKMSLNPGETGIDRGICATTVYRNQWDKVNGAPNSAILNIEGTVRDIMPRNQLGYGISFFHDAIGFNRQNNVLLNVSYPFQVPGVGTLGVGLGVGITNMGNSPVWVPPTTAVDPTLPSGFAATNLDMNFGLYWKGASDYYVGLSSTHLNQSLLSQTVGAVPQTYQMARHYYLMGGKKFMGILAGGDIDAQMLLRTDFVKFSADLNVRYIWNNMLYGGLAYRTSDAVCIMLGATPITNLTVGYSYDVTINKLSSVSRGSHEIMLKYCHYLPTPPITKAKHPRWL